MATGRAIELKSEHGGSSGEVVAFRPRADRATAPRQSLDARLARAGFALATQLFNTYDGTDASHDTHVHVPTVIGVLGTLAAEFAQAAASVNRREAMPIATGGWVLGGAADAILFSAEDAGCRTVWQMIVIGAMAAGMPLEATPDMNAIVAHAEATVGEKPYPVLTVASPYRPKALLRAAAARHRHMAQAVAADEGLCSAHEQALVAGAAIAQILKAEARPEPLTLLAAEVMIGAARLTPLPFAVS
jgi:hypothetical protein